MQNSDPAAESVESGGPQRLQRHDNGLNGLPPPYGRDTTRDGQSVKPTSRRPRLTKRGLSRTMTEWKLICANRNLPDTSSKPTDYVIVYRYLEKGNDAETTNDDDDNEQVDKSISRAETTNDETETGGCCCCGGKSKQQSAIEARQAQKRFRRQLEREGIEITAEHRNDEKQLVYMMLHTPFWRLCTEAERVCLKMPLKNSMVYDEVSNCCVEAINRCLETDSEDDYVSGPFLVDRFNIYKDSDNVDKFFRPALRSLLTHTILINIGEQRKSGELNTDLNSGKDDDRSYLEATSDETTRKGLLYMLHHKYFLDAFTLHDQSGDDPGRKILVDMMYGMHGINGHVAKATPLPSEDPIVDDTRRDLDRTWARSCRFQPLWKIRNYFGEKIALYFAWCGTLILTLWLPMLFGFAVFLYGLYLSITKHQNKSSSTWSSNTTQTSAAKTFVEESIGIVKESFDNDVTPFYALVMTIWGTVFLEVWKRTNNTLSYEWDVNAFENNEPDRPQFVGNKITKDPVTGLTIEDTTFTHKCIRFTVSVATLLFMVSLVFIVAAAVIVYRVVLTVDYCTAMTPVGCLLATTIGSSLLNAVAIIILGKIYDYLAVKLTEWENHRTQTEYNDSLIIKTFAFQFANSYTSLFYIAFFRGRAFQNGLFGLGGQYSDTCGDSNTTCMSMLSFQVLTLMLTKPLPKFLMDIVLPLAKWLWFTKIKRHCCKGNKVGDNEKSTSELQLPPYWEVEHQKQDPGDFTLMEYTEKVIIYGFVMLFAVSLSLAPMIAMIILVIDIRVDAKRMLWLQRRPIAYIAQDIGTWYYVLEFLNIVGVVTNACLIAFTSSWGQKYDMVYKLVIVIGFEHIVFAVKFILAVLIPDVPEDIKLAIRRETYQNQRIREDEKFGGNSGKLATVAEENEVPSKTSKRRKASRSADGSKQSQADDKQSGWREDQQMI